MTSRKIGVNDILAQARRAEAERKHVHVRGSRATIELNANQMRRLISALQADNFRTYGLDPVDEWDWEDSHA